MSALISSATGNLTASGTWSLADPTSFMDSEAATTAISGAGDSGNFIPGAITIDAMAFKVASRVASPTGTITMTLRDQLAGTDVVSVTVNQADIGESGWHVLKLAAPVTLVAIKQYLIRMQASVSSQVTIYRNASLNNWARALRVTTNQAPVAGDQLIIAGELTGAGTGNNFTVTMDQTAITSYGSASFPHSIGVSKRGTLTCAASASTAYNLKWKGIMRVSGGGILNTGTTGTPMPSTSSLTLTMDVATNVDSGLVIGTGGTWNGRGNAISNTNALLAANAAALATSLTTNISTGWKSGDVIAIAPSQRNNLEAEKVTLSGDASGTAVPIGALVNAHSGQIFTKNGINFDTRSEIINLTRNVVVIGTSSSLQGYIFFDNSAIIDIQYHEIAFMGSGTANKRGIDVQTTTGSCALQFCSIHDFIVSSSIGFNLGTSNCNNITYNNNVSYNHSLSHIVTQPFNTNSNLTFTNIIAILHQSTSPMLWFQIAGATYSNITCAGGAANGIGILLGANTPFANTVSNIVVHSCNGVNMDFSHAGGTVSGIKCYRGSVSNRSNICWAGLVAYGSVIDNLQSFGNVQSGFSFEQDSFSGNGSFVGRLIIKNSTFDSDPSLSATPIGINFTSSSNGISPGHSKIEMENCTVGANYAFTTGDFVVPAGYPLGVFMQMVCRMITTGSTTRFSGNSNLVIGSYISFQRLNGTAGNHLTYMDYGVLSIDTVISGVASPSMRMAPINASNKLNSGVLDQGFLAPVANGQSLTASVAIRKSVVGDGSAYNGNQPRLIVRKNICIGINADTVLATYSAAAGSWNTISGTTVTATDDGVMEFIIDCDGTAGWINIDDFAVS